VKNIPRPVVVLATGLLAAGWLLQGIGQDQITPVEEVMRAFDDLMRQGKILYAGVSDMPAWVVSKANTLADLRGWTPFVGLQIEYSLYRADTGT
jgi:aryl-alcohol dehydrogenase-like predicted oxidoreductase